MTLFDIDRDAFAASFPDTPFKLRHRLAESPLFTVEAMATLAASLPADKVDYNRADIPADVSGAAVPGNGLSVAETVRDIEACASWMVLKGIEHVPAYADILDRLVDELAEAAGLPVRAFGHRVALGFVTSPGGVTPFHLDSEHNFLLQMRGTKRMTILPHRGTVRDADLEIAPSKSRYIAFEPEFAPIAREIDLAPGDAVCVPFNDPHHVKNGPAVSISMGITFHDADSWKLRKVATMNHLLRRAGWPQARPGVHPRADALKAAAYTAASAVVEPVRRNAGARQFVKRYVLRGAAMTPQSADRLTTAN